MSNEHTIFEFDIQLITDFFIDLDRQGPGGDTETCTALGFVKEFTKISQIADLGSGTGKQTLTLATHTAANITAVDLSPEMVNGLNKRILVNGLEHRVSGLVASMEELPFETHSLDLIWAESSIYNMGFERGFTEWKKFLKPGGFIVVSDCCWLKGEQPLDKFPELFQMGFPEIDTVSNKLRIIEQAGYQPIAHFAIPESCWLENYYKLMEEHFPVFLNKHHQSKGANQFVELMKAEITCYRAFKAYYGYVFFVAQSI